MPAAKKNTRHRNFGSPKNAELEPLTFELYDEEFTCYPEVQGYMLLNFSQQISSEDQSEVTGALLGFFKNVLLPESYERLEVLWTDPERIVQIETLSDIVGWLVEEYTDRPTPASEES